MFNSFLTELTGGIDFDSTPRSLVFQAGQTVSCLSVDIFTDSVIETAEQFSVLVISTSSNSVSSPRGSAPIITITDDEGTEPY